MSLKFDGSRPFRLETQAHQLSPLYKSKKGYRKLLSQGQEELNELQRMMYAHGRYGLLVIFQAMDAAGKDGTIRNVFSGVHPHGVSVHPFKRPTDEELDHDFLWRSMDHLPRRGSISVFNRSYYEEVLVAKVHPEIVTKYQRMPDECRSDLEKVWEKRYASIREHESHLVRNGTRILKFFLNVGKDEQCRRFISRIDEPEKNWKFNVGDLEERKHWENYQNAYETAIQETGTKDAPWHVIPADDKKNARLMISEVIREELKNLDMSYPSLSEKETAELAGFRKELEAEL